MRFLFTLLAFALAASAFASYDDSFYQTDYWSGEYPTGFSVIKRGTVVAGRASMDLDAPREIRCRLPYRAVYHPWNAARKAQYRTASRIILLTASADFELGDGIEERVTVKMGETLEYLMYGAEGIFSVRYQGKIYSADQGIFSSVEGFDESLLREDAWVRVSCLNRTKAWIFMGDVVSTDELGNTSYLPGLDVWSRGLREYGKVTDLTDKDLAH